VQGLCLDAIVGESADDRRPISIQTFECFSEVRQLFDFFARSSGGGLKSLVAGADHGEGERASDQDEQPLKRNRPKFSFAHSGAVTPSKLLAT
jgi:hypothetical protein